MMRFREPKYELTRRYLEQKYDVNLSEVRIERPLYGGILYNVVDNVVILSTVSGKAAPLGAAAMNAAAAFYASARGEQGIVLLTGIVACYCAAVGAALHLSTRTEASHELAHAAVWRLTVPDKGFNEALAVHEEFRDPTVPPFSRMMQYVAHGLLPAELTVRMNGWQPVIDWMDHPRRERKIKKLGDALCRLGSPHAGDVCAYLAGMQPRRYVEEHIMLGGLNRYAAGGDASHLEMAYGQFLEDAGSRETADRYMTVLPKLQ